MSKEEIKELLRGLFIDYDTHRWSNDGVYEKYTELLYKPIADLEAKLAESEEKKESYRLQNDEHHLQLLQFYSRLSVEAFGADIHEKALETLMIMKEQLAEKEKEIAYLTKQVKKFNNEAQKYFEDAYCNDFHNQDKISFALEQLEQIRKEFEIKFKGCKWEDKMLVGKFCNITNETIDNQINVLRNNKDGIH